nr:ribonucleases P:MRP protein subunit POP1 [Hymenolepis microstoma]
MNPSHRTQNSTDRTEENAINVDVLRLLAARSAEMMACESSVHITTARAVAPLQKLPVRLRRRAASHKLQRLPRRLHQGVAQSLSKKLVGQAKKCRRFHRRPQRLAALAAHRAQIPVSNFEGNGVQARWIPTALWHAKRFHIIQNWGWRIPYAPTDKMFKTLQRATTDRCMLIDQGYLNCFALTGPVDVLNRCIEETTLPYYVSSISPNYPDDASQSPGFQETVRLLCREAIQPRAPIGIARLPNISRPILGPLRILKGPVRQFENGKHHSTVWFWLHPTMSSDAWKMVSSLNYVCTDQEETFESTHIKLTDCTGHLCRMKLIGPFSHQILADILQPHSEVPGSGDWPLWKALSDYQKSSLFPSGCALTLLCSPFLTNRPRMKVFNRNWLIPEPKMGRDSTNPSGSFVSKALSQFEFLKIQQDKRDLTFSGRIVQWFSSSQPCCFSNAGVPIILIQNATPSLSSQKSQCVGWDVVLPRQLLKPLTDDNKNATPAVNTSAPRDLVVACVYRGIRVGGLRDQLRWACLTTEAAARVDAFPYALWPETPAAKLITDEKLHIKVERNENGKLTGDAKRRARIKFRCSPPTTKDWLELMEPFHPSVPTSQGGGDGTAENSFFFVLRDKAMLALVVRRLLAGDPRARHLTVDHLSRYDPDLPRALVLIYVENTFH